MKLLSPMFINLLLKFIEYEFVNHEPQLKEVFLKEVRDAVDLFSNWVNSQYSAKIKDKNNENVR